MVRLTASGRGDGLARVEEEMGRLAGEREKKKEKGRGKIRGSKIRNRKRERRKLEETLFANKISLFR